MTSRPPLAALALAHASPSPVRRAAGHAAGRRRARRAAAVEVTTAARRPWPRTMHLTGNPRSVGRRDRRGRGRRAGREGSTSTWRARSGRRAPRRLDPTELAIAVPRRRRPSPRPAPTSASPTRRPAAARRARPAPPRAAPEPDVALALAQLDEARGEPARALASGRRGSRRPRTWTRPSRAQVAGRAWPRPRTASARSRRSSRCARPTSRLREERLAHATVRAPFDGRRARAASSAPADRVAIGAPVARLRAARAARLRVEVPELRRRGRDRRPAPAASLVDGTSPGAAPLEGVVARISRRSGSPRASSSRARGHGEGARRRVLSRRGSSSTRPPGARGALTAVRSFAGVDKLLAVVDGKVALRK